MVVLQHFAVSRTTGSVRLLQTGMFPFRGETTVVARSDASSNEILRLSGGMLPCRTRGRWGARPRSGLRPI